MADRITLDVAHIAEQLELEVLEAGEGSVTFTSAEIGRQIGRASCRERV